jgi:hypothetical protein
LAGWTAASGGHGGRADGGIVAHGADGFQGHVAGALGDPFVGLFEQNCADQLGDGSPYNVANLRLAGLQDIGQRYVAMYQGMAEGFVASAKAMTSAKSLHEAATIQTSYFKTAREQVTGQAAQIGEATAQLFKQAPAPMVEQAAASAMMVPASSPPDIRDPASRWIRPTAGRRRHLITQ